MFYCASADEVIKIFSPGVQGLRILEMYMWSMAMNGGPVRSGPATESERKRKKSTDSVDNEDERLSHSLPYTTGLRLHTDKTWAKLELINTKQQE